MNEHGTNKVSVELSKRSLNQKDITASPEEIAALHGKTLLLIESVEREKTYFSAVLVIFTFLLLLIAFIGWSSVDDVVETKANQGFANLLKENIDNATNAKLDEAKKELGNTIRNETEFLQEEVSGYKKQVEDLLVEGKDARDKSLALIDEFQKKEDFLENLIKEASEGKESGALLEKIIIDQGNLNASIGEIRSAMKELQASSSEHRESIDKIKANITSVEDSSGLNYVSDWIKQNTDDIKITEEVKAKVGNVTTGKGYVDFQLPGIENANWTRIPQGGIRTFEYKNNAYLLLIIQSDTDQQSTRFAILGIKRYTFENLTESTN